MNEVIFEWWVSTIKFTTIFLGTLVAGFDPFARSLLPSAFHTSALKKDVVRLRRIVAKALGWQK